MKLFFLENFLLTFLILNVLGIESLDVKSRVLGKSGNAGYNQFTWHALLRLDDGTNCNGALISEKWVLSTATCVFQAKSVEVWLGSNEMNESEVVKSTVTEITLHPDFDYNKSENDIALLKLPEEVKIEKNIKPVTIVADENDRFVNKLITLSSFGPTEKNSDEYSYNLKYSLVKVIPNKKCTEMYKKGKVLDSMMCTVSQKGWKTEMCNGDEGSPATVASGGKYPLIGLYTFSNSDCTNPMIFTRINAFTDWITDTSGVEAGKEW